jgi:hypothetical protein
MVSGTGPRLTTWHDVHGHLSTTYAGVTVEQDGAISVVVELPRTSTAPASSLVMEVRQVQVLASMWLKVTCVIGSLHHLSPTEMLGNNVRDTIGTYCTRDGQLAVRQTLPLVGLQLADLDETVRALAQQAGASRTRIRELAG